MGLVNRKQKRVEISFNDILDYAFNLKTNKNLKVVKKVAKTLLEEEINYNGIVFRSEENKIYFSFPKSDEESGHILLEERVGNILKLFIFNNNVYAFCEKGIIKIIPSGKGEEFYIKRLDLIVNNVEKESVQKLGDTIIFVMNNTLCQFKNDKISIKDFIYNGKIDYLGGYSFLEEDKYVYCLEGKVFDRKNAKLVYQPLTEEIYLEDDLEPYFKGKNISFSTDALKNIEEINFSTDGEIVMILSTDTVIKRYTLKEGIKSIKPYIKCTSFRLDFILKTAKNVENLKVIYAI